MNLPKNLKLLRKDFGVNQTELGEATGLTRNQIASYEQGIAEPNICGQIKLANYFSVTIDELIKGKL